MSADADTLDIVSFNLMLAVQLCADIASHVIADEEWTPAKSIAESFSRIEEHGVISATTGDSAAQSISGALALTSSDTLEPDTRDLSMRR